MDFDYQHKLYTEGTDYDVTLAVGAENPATIFRCHRLVLAHASVPFNIMFFGNFEESDRDKDDPILIEQKMSPAAFDAAMRFIYGNVREFQNNTTLACEVFQFAHKWMMKILKEAAAEELRKAEMKDVLMVYDMFKFLNEKEEQEILKKIIRKNTSEILRADTWPSTPAAIVLEIFSEKTLNVSCEEELFRALIQWGDANLNECNLRTKIDSALKQIRFLLMNPDLFVLLQRENIFSPEERANIYLSIANQDPTRLPPGFSRSQEPRELKIDLEIEFCLVENYSAVNSRSQVSSLTFSLQETVHITHFVLNCLRNEGNYGKGVELVCKLSNASLNYTTLAYATFKGMIGRGTGPVFFARPVQLKAGNWYNLSVQYLMNNSLVAKSFGSNGRLEAANWDWTDKEEMEEKLKVTTEGDFIDLSGSHVDIERIGIRFVQ
ncbi:Hypothetical predicted protein [Cloeon dipterum]|uniref:BTB domain-containing protein n=1 Tax=Cloeon dipterum TaxID=197152 RepID=A0A8S1DLW8_9INSE|nr:Hypothetical predicted protein [Cloeon dipterum]